MKDSQTVPRPSIPPKRDAGDISAEGKPSDVRHISEQKHQKIKRKVLALHDGLLRRLAEHDRQQ